MGCMLISNEVGHFDSTRFTNGRQTKHWRRYTIGSVKIEIVWTAVNHLRISSGLRTCSRWRISVYFDLRQVIHASIISVRVA